jgi:C4-dicarboxylate transporter, DctQ subunit
MNKTALGRSLEKIGHGSAWLFFAVLVISTLEVALRYLFSAPTSWVHVTSTAMSVTAFAVAGSYAMVQDQHMRITVLIDKVSPHWQTFAHGLGLFCGAVYVLGLGWGLYKEALNAIWRFDEGRWTPELTAGPPNWPLPAIAKLALVAGALLFFLAICEAVLRMRRNRQQAEQAALNEQA